VRDGTHLRQSGGWRSRGAGRPTALRALAEGADSDVTITSLANASDRVQPGALFFCVPGFRADGHAFAPSAVRRGAAAVVCERPLGLGVPELIVPDARAAMATVAARFYGHPSRNLSVVGVTGTNGKTTVTWLLRAILEEAGVPTGVVGTVLTVIGGVRRASARTTPESIELQADLRRMVEAGDRACALEVSSHGLALHRADEIEFSCRIFTNLSHDHLDFHGSMERYFAAKRRLFAGSGLSIVNVDDRFGQRLARELPGCLTYGSDRAADYRADDVEFDATGSRFACDLPAGRLDVSTALPGVHNVLNALAAMAAADALGIERDVMQRALAAAEPVRGRLEPVVVGQPFAVFVDYAHNPAALESVLRTARPLTRGRVHVVFGAPGDRDRSKRPEMGAVGRTLADRVTVTSDDPYSEDPESIIDEIVAGAGPDALREVDRQRAIQRAIDAAEPGDTVIVAGRGHELVQEFAGRRLAFDDAAVIRAALRRRGWCGGRAGERLARGATRP
jgi:UDP-N-acetylmuramoyl-L-alanyl-D-glutamate--2,6-diaminopimelate ligase